MKSSAKAFAPGNISCVFKIHDGPRPEKMGSYGLGFTINKGVNVEVSIPQKSRNNSDQIGIYFNNIKINFPTVKSVEKKLTRGKGKKVKINIISDLPLGSGFGLSGASALATTYALNDLMGLRYAKLELAKIAHIAEVENKTGLGDVVNQYFGGFLLKLKPSNEFEVKKIPIENVNVYCKYFSKLSTKKILSDQKIKERINNSAEIALRKIEKLRPSSSFKRLISISKEFSVKSGLLTNKRVKSEIEKIEELGGFSSMIMLGNAVFSDIPFPGAIRLKISNTSAYLV